MKQVKKLLKEMLAAYRARPNHRFSIVNYRSNTIIMMVNIQGQRFLRSFCGPGRLRYQPTCSGINRQANAQACSDIKRLRCVAAQPAQEQTLTGLDRLMPEQANAGLGDLVAGLYRHRSPRAGTKLRPVIAGW